MNCLLFHISAVMHRVQLLTSCKLLLRQCCVLIWVLSHLEMAFLISKQLSIWPCFRFWNISLNRFPWKTFKWKYCFVKYWNVLNSKLTVFQDFTLLLMKCFHHALLFLMVKWTTSKITGIWFYQGFFTFKVIKDKLFFGSLCLSNKW